LTRLNNLLNSPPSLYRQGLRTGGLDVAFVVGTPFSFVLGKTYISETMVT
jgi:hypothetical protein